MLLWKSYATGTLCTAAINGERVRQAVLAIFLSGAICKRGVTTPGLNGQKRKHALRSRWTSSIGVLAKRMQEAIPTKTRGAASSTLMNKLARASGANIPNHTVQRMRASRLAQ